MLRICFKQQAEEGYSLSEGRLSREFEAGGALAWNRPQKPQVGSWIWLESPAGGDLNNFALHQSPPPLRQDQSSSSSQQGGWTMLSGPCPKPFRALHTPPHPHWVNPPHPPPPVLRSCARFTPLRGALASGAWILFQIDFLHPSPDHHQPSRSLQEHPPPDHSSSSRF